MGAIYNIAVQTGNTYTDKEGNERQGTMICGKVIETSKGGKMAILDGLPFGALAKGEPIILYFNDIKPRDGEGDRPRPARPRPQAEGTDTDDIPF